ncbi:MAG: TIGR00730 family Rossman fold protein [Verrucomicrobiaceae bacterium]|nr:TIGR00730 family Rossman fold protein [Verrucomicrobiaceae bacterium]
MNSLAVYCGASKGHDSVHLEHARKLGRLMGDRKITLVYGGGSVGLMGAIADATMDAGGNAIGVIPRFLDEHELGHKQLTELIVVETMHERKQKMIDLAEGFIALPGGFGTLEELGEVLAWRQLGLHNCPCGVLNVKGYYNGLIEFADRMHTDGLLRKDDRDRLLDHEDPATLLDQMAAWHPPSELKWEYLKRENL